MHFEVQNMLNQAKVKSKRAVVYQSNGTSQDIVEVGRGEGRLVNLDNGSLQRDL